LVSALVAGMGLLTLQFVFFWPGRRGAAYLATARRLGQLFLGLLILGLIVSALGGLVILYPGVPAQATALQLTLFGPFWWVYWIFHIGLGVVVPTILLLTQTQTARRIGIAAALFVVTFIAVPLNIVIPPQLVVEVVEKGLVIAYQGPGLTADYFPTLSEWLLLLFALSFGFLVFLYGYNVLWLRPRADEPVEDK
jgi:protein NrfD